MSNAKVIHFVPRAREPQMLELPVRWITTAPHSKKVNTNHWCLYLATSDRTSVRLDCQPSHAIPSTVLRGGSKANLVVSELPYLCSWDAQTQFKLQVPPNLKVKDIYNFLIQNGRHKYEFNADGVGCRCWVMGQIDLLQQHGFLVNPTEVKAAKDGILLLWPDQTPLALDEGAYYQ